MKQIENITSLLNLQVNAQLNIVDTKIHILKQNQVNGKESINIILIIIENKL